MGSFMSVLLPHRKGVLMYLDLQLDVKPRSYAVVTQIGAVFTSN